MLAANARKHGLILRFIGNRIAFSPPLVINAEEVEEMTKRLISALNDTWRQVRT
jgi:4-aminobutyrate--pyruvate transaminase